MKEYIMTVVGVSVFCGIVEMLSPNEEIFKKHVKLIASLCVLCVAIAPIGSVIQYIGEWDLGGDGDSFDEEEIREEYYDVYLSNLGEYSAEIIAERLEGELCDEFDIESEDIDVLVSVISDDSEISVEGIQVILYPGAIFKDPKKISEYIFELLGCECEIIYK